MGQIGLSQFGVNIVSVFNNNLPIPLCSEPEAVQKWKDRQDLEEFFRHPLFDPIATRQHVLGRLQDWSQRGIAASMRANYHPSSHMPSDAHILENLVIKLLHRQTRDFTNRYLALHGSLVPPCTQHDGQYPPAFLRQVADQRLHPRPEPHYEVVVGTGSSSRVWKLQHTSFNLAEALGLFLFVIRQNPQCYAEFPRSFTEAVDAAASPNPSALARGLAGLALLVPAWMLLEGASSSPVLLVVLAACAAAGCRLWWWLALRVDELVRSAGYRASTFLGLHGTSMLDACYWPLS
jgi:hypothetical protein